MFCALLVLFPILGTAFAASSAAAGESLNGAESLSRLEGRDGNEPGFPYAPDTTPYCSFWYDNDGYLSFEDFLYLVYLPAESFVGWVSQHSRLALGWRLIKDTRQNPSVTLEGENFNVNQSYCVEAINEPNPEQTTTSITELLATKSLAVSEVTASRPPSSITTLQSPTGESAAQMSTIESAEPTSTTESAAPTSAKPYNGMFLSLLILVLSWCASCTCCG